VDKKDIKELSLIELEILLNKWQERVFHAQQVFAWVYKKGAANFEEMTDLSAGLRQRLKENFYLSSLRLAESQNSYDATAKLAFKLKDGNFIEGVIIPAKGRITGCISTQVGCKFACKFCASGILGFKRNLTTGEIIEQVLYLKNAAPGKKLTHLVFMGIGEPLDNYEHVLKAIRIINSPEALNIGARRITISTCGITPAIKKLSDEGLQIELSVSLHAADEKTRSMIMPVNKKYPLAGLIAACRQYIKETKRQITFEYVLIKGLNSDLPNAKNLLKILGNLRLCKINLIPVNIIKELRIESPNKLDILLFRDYLLKQGINVTLRKPRGEDIKAACGQLRLRYEKK
jgi:23S rRNA (adenine2503-C2)-methyltransferase